MLLNLPWKVSPSSPNITTKSTIHSKKRPSKEFNKSRRCENADEEVTATSPRLRATTKRPIDMGLLDEARRIVGGHLGTMTEIALLAGAKLLTRSTHTRGLKDAQDLSAIVDEIAVKKVEYPSDYHPKLR
jgi:hypothetical protein